MRKSIHQSARRTNEHKKSPTDFSKQGRSNKIDEITFQIKTKEENKLTFDERTCPGANRG